LPQQITNKTNHFKFTIMKKVFNSAAEVFHLFAQRSQTEANSLNVFMKRTYSFNKDYANEIFSYGNHYLLAEFLSDPDNPFCDMVYINDGGYSVTTAKHIAQITAATRQYKQLKRSQTITPILEEIKEVFKALGKAKKPEKYISIIKGHEDALNVDFFPFVSDSQSGLKFLKFKELSKDIQKQIKEARKICVSLDSINLKAYQQAEKAKAEKAKKAKEKVFETSLKKWMNNEINSYQIARNPTNEDYLRINGEIIETTQGAKVDIKEAAFLYSMIKAGKDIKGHKINNYTVISLNGVLQIGCHQINVKNMHKIGKQITK
jgi:hypothetical protein